MIILYIIAGFIAIGKKIFFFPIAKKICSFFLLRLVKFAHICTKHHIVRER